MATGDSRSDSSSGEEDGDAEWMAAISSVTASAANGFNGLLPSSSNGGAAREGENKKRKPQKPKLYQIKAGKLLEDILDQSIEWVSERSPKMVEEDPAAEDAGVRLFRSAPRGIVFDHREELVGPKKRPRILPGEDLDEKSKKLRKQFQSVAVDGADIVAAASKERQKALARLEARENAAKTRAKREEDRVAELKRIRGERWLPCVAREMRLCKPKIVKQ